MLLVKLIRKLQIVIDYKEWSKFEGVIEKSKLVCQNSYINVFEHFIDADKLLKHVNNTEVRINDYKFSHYACYSIVQNEDSRKK